MNKVRKKTLKRGENKSFVALNLKQKDDFKKVSFRNRRFVTSVRSAIRKSIAKSPYEDTR